MEFLGAMFKGIGDTFTAGANVNLGQMNERNVKRQIALSEDTLRADQELAQYDLLKAMEAEKFKKMGLIAISLLLLLFMLLKYRN